MNTKRVTPNIKGVVFNPEMRYMINTKTGNVYPYSDVLFEKNSDLREFFPQYRVVEAAKPDAIPEVVGGDIIEPIEIDEVVVDIPAPVATTADEAEPIADTEEPVDPRIANLEKARAARSKKNKE